MKVTSGRVDEPLLRCCWRLIGESNHPWVWEAMDLVRAALASGIEEEEILHAWMYRHNYEEGLTWPMIPVTFTLAKGYGPLIECIALVDEVDVVVTVVDILCWRPPLLGAPVSP